MLRIQPAVLQVSACDTTDSSSKKKAAASRNCSVRTVMTWKDSVLANSLPVYSSLFDGVSMCIGLHASRRRQGGRGSSA